MATVVKRLGPADHGRRMTLEEFMAGDYIEGYEYELVDGKLYVSPEANLPEFRVEDWIHFKLKLYAHYHREIINFVANKARVFVPSRRRVTNPEPDVAAYHDFPLELPWNSVRWQDVSPILVVEVLSLDDPDKDLVRNVELYLQVPSIKEYWLFDTRDDPEQLRLQVRRRYRGRWSLREYGPGDIYTPKLLPEFTLVLHPRS
ncbi:MAG TPA: Uma2 family endonuclease [Gemmataceae bacterium]|nr:Uma2 family endonuclease [Gemmataceae bacterium]